MVKWMVPCRSIMQRPITVRIYCEATMLNKIDGVLRGIGHRVIDRIWRLGVGVRFFLYTLIYSGESFRRIHLTIREIYFTGVMSMIIILVSAFFVGMVLALQGYN